MTEHTCVLTLAFVVILFLINTTIMKINNTLWGCPSQKRLLPNTCPACEDDVELASGRGVAVSAGIGGNVTNSWLGLVDVLR